MKLILKEMARFGEDNSDLQSLENFRECVKYMSEFLEGILKPLSYVHFIVGHPFHVFFLFRGVYET